MVLTFPCVWYCHMAWFLTAASRKEQALNTFNVQMKFVTSLGSLMYDNEVGVCVYRHAWDGLGGWGWVAAGKTFLIYPLFQSDKNLVRNKGLHQKWCHSQSLHLHIHWVGTQRVHQGAIWIQKCFAARGRKETKKRKKEKRQEEIRSGFRSCWSC